MKNAVAQPATIALKVSMPAPTVLTTSSEPVLTPPQTDDRRVSPHYEHTTSTYRVDGKTVVELTNPDTGTVDVTIHEDAAEAWRWLAEGFADDL